MAKHIIHLPDCFEQNKVSERIAKVILKPPSALSGTDSVISWPDGV